MTLHIEDNLAAVTYTLKTDLPDVITAINALDDGDDLDQIAAWEQGYDDVMARSAYPLVAVVSGDVEYEPTGQGALDARQEVVVLVAFRVGGSPSWLSKACMRYAEAVREVIQENPTLYSRVLYATPERTELFEGAAGNKSFGVVKVTLQIETEVRGG